VGALELADDHVDDVEYLDLEPAEARVQGGEWMPKGALRKEWEPRSHDLQVEPVPLEESRVLPRDGQKARLSSVRFVVSRTSLSVVPRW
jgi:hypothetical protein